MFYCYIASLILINIPFFALSPQFNIINTSLISRILTLIVFISILISNKKTHRLILLTQKIRVLVISLLIFFFSISLSIISSLNPILFLNKYESIVFAMLMFINSIYYSNKLNISFIKYIIYFWLLINISNELFILIDPKTYLSIIVPLLDKEQANFVYNVNSRSRLLLTTYNELFFPLIMLQIMFAKMAYKKTIYCIGLLLIVILSFLSGWRIRIILIILGVIILFIHAIKTIQIQKRSFLIILLLLFIVTIFFNCLLNIQGSSIKGLFVNEDSINSNITRISIIQEYYSIFSSFPIMGVGLNNTISYRVKDYINPLLKVNKNNLELFLKADGHNFFLDILTETGIIGLISLLIFLIICLHNDIKLISYSNIKNNPELFGLIFCFWLIIIFSLFHSIEGYRFYSLLFIIRAYTFTNNYQNTYAIKQ